MGMKVKVLAGSHLPVLMKLLPITSGSVLELGVGIFSTTFLHWACFPNRRLVSYESNPEWFDFANRFARDFHEINCITDWDSIDLSENWSIVLVDHAPEQRRVDEIRKLTHAEYVVAHDADNKRNTRYNYPSIISLFKYRTKYNGAGASTAIYSNLHDLEGFQ